MSGTIAYYHAQADECAAAAAAAPLDNVKMRFLRAEAAWRQMADRLVQTEINREVNEARKAETSMLG